jgi:hypothetical protein
MSTMSYRVTHKKAAVTGLFQTTAIRSVDPDKMISLSQRFPNGGQMRLEGKIQELWNQDSNRVDWNITTGVVRWLSADDTLQRPEILRNRVVALAYHLWPVPGLSEKEFVEMMGGSISAVKRQQDIMRKDIPELLSVPLAQEGPFSAACFERLRELPDIVHAYQKGYHRGRRSAGL